MQKAHPDFYVAEAGSASTGQGARRDVQLAARAGRADRRSRSRSLILLLVFGSLVGASIPLLLALTAVFATMGLVALPSQLVPMDESISEVILLIGLAVGVDYSLFYIRRERDERARRPQRDARRSRPPRPPPAGPCSSPGITVMIAMAGMFFSGDKTFMSFAIGTMMVVAVAMIGSLTVLPAILSWLGDRVEKGRVPFLRRRRRDDGEQPRLGRDPRPRPAPPARLGRSPPAAVLVVLALPALHLHTADSGLDALPKSLPAIAGASTGSTTPSPAAPTPAVVAIKADDVDARAEAAAIADLQAHGARLRRDAEPIDGRRQHRTARVAGSTIPLAGKGTDSDVERTRSRRSATTSLPGDGRHRSPASSTRSPATRPRRRTSTTR